MCADKIEIRNVILDSKLQYEKTKDRRYIIDAAVLKGIYKSIGGQKSIGLPVYCSTISLATYSIAKAKSKMTGEIEKDVIKLNTELTKNMGFIIGIDLDTYEHRNTLHISTKLLANSIIIGVSDNLDDRCLANIATAIVTLTDNYSKLDKSNIAYINKCIENKLGLIDWRN